MRCQCFTLPPDAVVGVEIAVFANDGIFSDGFFQGVAVVQPSVSVLIIKEIDIVAVILLKRLIAIAGA